MMFSAWGYDHFRDALWDRAVPWPERAACIASLPAFYARAVSPALQRGEEDDDGWFMLPDFLAHGYGHSHGKGTRSRVDEEDRRMQDALYSAFRQMLASGDVNVNAAAVHGIFHLQHPDGSALVRGWLDVHPAMDRGLRGYAEGALERGHVL